MPWLYLILTFLVSIIAGFALFSRGAVYRTALGQIIQGILSLICFGFIVWAFWHYGWKTGLAETFVIFIGATVGQSILNGLTRR